MLYKQSKHAILFFQSEPPCYKVGITFFGGGGGNKMDLELDM